MFDNCHNMIQQKADIEIADTHIHIWNLEKIRYSWLDGDTSILNRTYLLEELQPSLQQVGISAGVLVQAANNLEDTYWMLETANRYDVVKGIVGWLPLTEPARVQQLLEDHFLQQPYFKGVRHLVHNEADPKWLLQDTVLESLRLLAAHNITYDIVGVNDDHLRTAIQVASKIPRLKMVLDHLNQPPISTKQRFGTWGGLMNDIATFPNVYAKISGLGTTSGKLNDWSADDIEPYIEFVLDAFGSHRCFCGGDWPVSLLAGSYEKLWSIYKEMLSKLLNHEELILVLAGNAKRFYQLEN